MNVLTLDVETDIHNRGNAFDDRNKLVCCAYKTKDNPTEAELWGDALFTAWLNGAVQSCDLVVGFNFKFDYHWLHNNGINLSGKRIWDCQAAHYVLTHQQHIFPSLNDVLAHYGLPLKIDLIKEEYWENKCTCYVTIANRLKSIMLNNSVLLAIIENMNKIGQSREQQINGLGDWQIQNVMQLFRSVELQNLIQILQKRLEYTTGISKENTIYQKKSVIDSWRKQYVQFVGKSLDTSTLTTTTIQEKSEICCVLHVMLLWDILNEQSGWNEHHHTCRPTPISTSDIPWDVLQPYAVGDVDGTYEVFKRQWEEATVAQRALILLDGQDMHVLREMEFNGILYDRELVRKREHETDDKIREIEVQLAAIYPHVPVNFRSNDDLSAFLYGGTIEETIKVHDGFYKTGIKKGQPKLKNTIVSHTLPALYKPVRGSELKKAGYYATNEPTLRSLKGNMKIVNLILDLAKLEKLNGTYYRGLPAISEEMNWKDNVLHSNFNLTQTKTGRLSSNKPNQQNFATDLLDIFISRYGD